MYRLPSVFHDRNIHDFYLFLSTHIMTAKSYELGHASRTWMTFSSCGTTMYWRGNVKLDIAFYLLYRLRCMERVYKENVFNSQFPFLVFQKFVLFITYKRQNVVWFFTRSLPFHIWTQERLNCYSPQGLAGARQTCFGSFIWPNYFYKAASHEADGF